MFTSEDQIVCSLLAADSGKSASQGIAGFLSRLGMGRGPGRIPKQVAHQLARMAKPCIWLETSRVGDEANILLGATKIGGNPDLPAGMSWPVRAAYPEGFARFRHYRTEAEAPDTRWSWAAPEQRDLYRRDAAEMLEICRRAFPLQFVVQINFEELWRAGPLDEDMPKSGLLSVFYDVLEQPAGFDPADIVGTTILFSETPGEALARRAPPEEVVRTARWLPIRPEACRAHACLSPLPVESVAFQRLQLSNRLRDVYWDWWSELRDEDVEHGLGWLGHQVGGWSVPVQNEMQTELALVSAGYSCGNGDAFRAKETASIRATADDWVLLIQIGSDFDLDASMMWGDSGCIYVWIRREDLVARRFEAARIIMQCH